jgi:prevent-host-death family protein
MYKTYIMNKSAKAARKTNRRSAAKPTLSGTEAWTLPATEARARFSEVVNRAAFASERVVLTRRGKRFAAVVPIEDLDFLEEMEDRADAEDYRAALKAAREKPRVKWEDLKKELGL